MNFFIRWAYPWVFLTIIPVLGAAWYRWYYYKSPTYKYTLVDEVIQQNLVSINYPKIFFFIVRLLLLALLVLLMAKPQLIDVSSQIEVEGIDIMIVLDVSGSMQCFDDLQDRRMRIEVAKQEAINFIETRKNDPIGLVLFANDALSRCPITLDKVLLKEIIEDTDIGVINPDGTVLALGIATAVNRLKQSQAKSKIMIVLTDGTPTPNDIPWQDAVAAAQKFGIKIYTIGIGNERGAYANLGVWGVQQVDINLNKTLLQQIADATGGTFFEAKKPADLKKIYTVIDNLEKTEYQSTIFNNYYDIFMPFLGAIFLVLSIELVCASYMWFGL